MSIVLCIYFRQFNILLFIYIDAIERANCQYFQQIISSTFCNGNKIRFAFCKRYLGIGVYAIVDS